MAERVPVSGEFYRHFKGKMYQIVTVAKDCNSLQPLVVYQALYEPYQCWVRELKEFLSPVDKEKFPDAKQEYCFEQVQMGAEKPPVPQPEETPVPDEEQVVKALKTGQPERYLAGKISNKEIAQIGFLRLLDAENFHEKRQIFLGLRSYLDQRMLSNIAVALDIVLEDGDLETQFASLLWCMEKLEHYEGGRLR